jgi:hypothetical protein
VINLSLLPVSCRFLAWLIFRAEDVGDVFSETSVGFQRTTRRYKPEDRTHYFHNFCPCICVPMFSWGKSHGRGRLGNSDVIITAFWDVTPSSLVEVYLSFGEMYCRHLYDRRVSRARKVLLLLSLLRDPEEGGCVLPKRQ